MKYLKITSMGLLAMALAACSSDDEVTSEELTRGVVKTEFNISVPPQAGTRQSDAVTQSAGNLAAFRGMQNVTMIPFATNGEIVSTDIRLGNNLTLITTGAVPAIQTNNTIASLNTNGTNSQYYKDVEVPIGTRSFLFYGVATDAAATSPATTQEVNGALTITGAEGNTPASITVDLVPIVTAETTDAMATALVDYLTAIANAKDATDTNADWSLATNMYNPLRNAFLNLNGTTASPMAGSSADLQALVQDLYTKLSDASNATATAIKTAILTKASADTDGKLTFDSTLGDTSNPTACYPSKIYLPDGAAVILWNTTSNAFEVVTAAQNFGVNVAQLTKYVYPASLYYRANSQISIDDENTHAADYTAATTTSWDNMTGGAYDANSLLGKYPTHQGVVTVNTKSIAMEEQVQYAVGRLDVKVKAAAATLADGEDASIALGTENFPITGVIIGGQKQVDFEFKPVASAAEYTIYDNQMATTSYLLTSTLTDDNLPVVNRTLVLETAEANDAVVKFAVEFQNNSGEAFVGKDGVIPNGCKFYLLGELDMSKLTNPTVPSIFKQDYVTTVIATVQNLKNAYNIIPDLRAPKLELGLSVNLEWQAGNVFTTEM